jgi:hypothetical protein
LQLAVRATNLGPRGFVDVTFVRIEVDGHDLGDLQPTTGPLPPIVQPAVGGIGVGGNRSLIIFSPKEFPPDHPYRLAMLGGPDGEPPTITKNTRVEATVRWTDASGKTWERWGAGPFRTGETAFKTELGPVQLVPGRRRSGDGRVASLTAPGGPEMRTRIFIAPSGLLRSGSPVRSRYAAESVAAFGYQQNQRSGLHVSRTAHTGCRNKRRDSLVRIE